MTNETGAVPHESGTASTPLGESAGEVEGAETARSRFTLTLARKIPLYIIGAAFVLAIALGVSNYISASNSVQAEAERTLTALTEARKSALDDYLASIQQDLLTQAQNPTVHRAIRDFMSGWQLLGGNETRTLQRLYIDENPHPTGQKENLDAAPDGSAYSAYHSIYHPYFRKFLRERGYYDIFLFNPQGDLVYTVFKELDYATNMNTGEYKDTDLGNAFRAAEASRKPGSPFFFDFKPYAPSHGAPASFISTPVLDEEGQLIGVLVFQMPIDRLNAVMQVTAGMGESGETYVVGEDFLMRTDSRFSDESTILARRVETAPVKAALAGDKGLVIGDDYRGVEVFSAFQPLDFLGTRWAILADKDAAEVLAPIDEMGQFMLVVGVLLLAAIGVVGYFLARGISRPITDMTDAMLVLSNGNKALEIPYRDRADEIGEMADAMQVFKDNAVEADRLAAEQEAEQQKREERARQIEALCNDFDKNISHIVQSVTSAATEMQASAETMAATSEETNRQSATVAAASEQATSNVQTVAAAAEEMAKSIQEISRQVSSSTDMASAAVSEAEQTNLSVEGLAKAAETIGAVVSLISDIAEQTNLLALNATIEAARAGEAGKGFAVVASEVKNLANQTAKATEEIAGQVTSMQSATGGAVEAIKAISDRINQVSEIASAIASAVEEQEATTQEIARNVQEAARGTQEVSSNIQNVNQAAQESGGSASQLLNAANELSQQGEELRGKVEAFLSDVRAA